MGQTCGQLSASDGVNTIAWRQQSGREPTILFLHGFRSDMTGTKAAYLSGLCEELGLGFLRFDLRGHGASSGHYTDFTIGDWRADVRQVIDQLTAGPLILVASSLGGWLALLMLIDRPERIAGLVTIAPAPDFPTRRVLPQLEPRQRETYARDHVLVDPDSGFDDPTRFTRRLIDESRAHNLLEQPPTCNRPLRILQGQQDRAVPWQQTVQLMEKMPGRDMQLLLFKSGDHRLNETAQLEELGRQVKDLSGSCQE